MRMLCNTAHYSGLVLNRYNVRYTELRGKNLFCEEWQEGGSHAEVVMTSLARRRAL
jgi:hypothetical protein